MNLEICKIKDIPSGRLFRSLNPIDQNLYQTFMLDGGYTLQLTNYIKIFNINEKTYTYWSKHIKVYVFPSIIFNGSAMDWIGKNDRYIHN